MSKIRYILKRLNEDFYSGVNKREGYFEIFKNPTGDEIKECVDSKYDEIRFIADKNKKEVYVFNGELLHKEACKELGVSYEFATENYLLGTGLVPKREIETDRIDLIFKLKPAERELKATERLYNDVMNGEYDWLSNYYFDLKWLRYAAGYLEKKIKRLRKVVGIEEGINEDFYNSFKWKGAVWEIFKNPSRKEILDIVNNNKYEKIRFIADKNKKEVLIFDFKLLHYQVQDKLKIKLESEGFNGEAEYRNGELLANVEDILKGERVLRVIAEDIINGEYDWMSNYYFNLDYMYSKAHKTLKRMNKI